ncbi:hypothetical protein EBT31_20190, partial [bacterium]|nr:hypothetical protein [bacterium]
PTLSHSVRTAHAFASSTVRYVWMQFHDAFVAATIDENGRHRLERLLGRAFGMPVHISWDTERRELAVQSGLPSHYYVRHMPMHWFLTYAAGADTLTARVDLLPHEEDFSTYGTFKDAHMSLRTVYYNDGDICHKDAVALLRPTVDAAAIVSGTAAIRAHLLRRAPLDIQFDSNLFSSDEKTILESLASYTHKM